MTLLDFKIASVTVAVADVRLAGSELNGEGRLELKIAGEWGTVCDDSFDDLDAGVACSMLDLGYVYRYQHMNIIIMFVSYHVTHSPIM